MVALRTRMGERYAAWRDDLLPGSGWPDFFDGCPPLDFGSIPEHLQIGENAPVWPGRRNMPNDGAPDGAHICRAFEGLEPDNVRVVVLGQDPYPDIAQATGRAFEDGKWKGGRTEEMAKSLKPLMLAALATRDDQAVLFRKGAWPEVRRQIRDEELVFPILDEYFNELAGQRVLFVNAAWTHTTPGDVGVHLKVWKPVLHYLLRKLARDAQEPLAFLLLGNKAQQRFSASEAETEAQNAETWGDLVTRMDLPHPRDAAFLIQNPWSCVNDALQVRNVAPVAWWPAP